MTPRETVIEAITRALWWNAWPILEGKIDSDFFDRMKKANPEWWAINQQDATTALNALLATLPALGLKIVPIEADEAMAEAWAGASIDTASAGLPDNEVNMLHAQSDWSAMIAAAPDPLEG